MTSGWNLPSEVKVGPETSISSRWSNAEPGWIPTGTSLTSVGGPGGLSSRSRTSMATFVSSVAFLRLACAVLTLSADGAATAP